MGVTTFDAAADEDAARRRARDTGSDALIPTFARSLHLFRAAAVLLGLTSIFACGCVDASDLGHRSTMKTAVPATSAKRPAALRDAGARSVKLIWFGTPMDPLAITPQNLENAGKAFDGFVVQDVHGSTDGDRVANSFQWHAFSVNHHYSLNKARTRFRYLGDELDALKNLPKSPMPYRFLRINSDPYDSTGFNWLDDGFWANTVNNMEVAGQLCHDAGLTGVFLDTEQYQGRANPNLYQYNAIKGQAPYAGMSYDQLAAAVEKRGEQVMQGLNRNDPNITIFISYGYSSILDGTTRDNLAQKGYLLAPFLDGMLEASTPGTTFIDGYEQAYWHTDASDFFSGMRHDILDTDGKVSRFQKSSDRYSRQYQFGPGLFLDRDNPGVVGHPPYGWCGDGKQQMFYSPARLAYTVQQAVKSSDSFMWIYSQRPNAWLPPDSAGALPTAYVNAIRDGQAHGNDLSLPSLPANHSPVDESSACR